MYKNNQSKVDKKQKESFEQDRFGYISPNLARLRALENPTLEERQQRVNIENKRATQHPRVNVETPDKIQPTGQPQLAQRNNNPGNLRFRNQPGAERGDKNFARFPSAEEGYYALENRIRLGVSQGNTLEQFFNIYAPSWDNNDTEKYIQSASRRLGVDRTTPISYIPLRELSQFVANYESGSKVTERLTPMQERLRNGSR